MWRGRCRLDGESADLDQVVGQDAVAGPDPGSFGAVDADAVPAVATLEGADAALAPGAPFDCSPERGQAFAGSSGGAGVARAGDHAFARSVAAEMYGAGRGIGGQSQLAIVRAELFGEDRSGSDAAALSAELTRARRLALLALRACTPPESVAK